MKPGYKQTEVGVIPEEWEVWRLKDCCQKLNVSFVGTCEPFYTRENSGVLMLRTGNLQGDQIVLDDCKFVTREFHARNRKSQVRTGDILIARHGNSGNAVPVPPEIDDVNALSIVILRTNEAILEKRFASYCINSGPVRSQATGMLAGSTQVVINTREVEKLRLPLPPLPEQRAIAEALSDVDGLLGGLDRLIAKKRDLKQAAMQQLLTGQTRLPGFHGEWEVKTLASVFEIMAGKSMSAYISDGGDFVICDMGSVSTEGRLIKTKRTNYRGDFLREGDLVMPKDDIGGGKIIGRVGYVDCSELYVLGDHVYRLRAIEGDPLFLSYLINSHSINSALRKKVIGSAQLGLGRRSVEEQEIPFPSTAEQTAIAQILSDMDAELTALEQRREKTRALKQAMMQDLLTGRTRLV